VRAGRGIAAAAALPVFLASCASGPALHGAAVAAAPTDIVWRAEDISGRGIIDRSYVTVLLAADGQASGSAGCNRFMARHALAGARLTLAGIASTRKACAPALMEQEARYIAMLTDIAQWRIEATGALVLITTKGAPLRFFPEEPAPPR
jgi:heat shock protein HslJ